MTTKPPEPNIPGEPVPGDEAHAAAPVPNPGPVRWHGLVAVLGTIRKVVDRLLALLCIVLFVMLVIIVTWQVFTREVMNNSAPWTQEAALFTFVVLAMLAAAYVFSERGHIAVEMLIEKLPYRAQKVVGILVEIVVIFFFISVFVMGGLRVAENAWGQGVSTLPLTVGQIYLVMPLAGVLTVFYSLAHIIGILAGIEKPVPSTELEEAI